MAQETPQKREQKLGVVFGGSGLIGGTIVNYFMTKHPGLVDMRAPSSKKVSLRSCMDIREYLMSIKPDFIINTAIANIDSDSQLAFDVNYIGPLNIARAAAALKTPFINLSSAATLPTGTDLKEEDQVPITSRLSNYAKTKLMAEKTLKYMAENEGLDYSCIRLSVVYGNHDHKIQGFHRLLFSIADESMPFMFTKKGIVHSYTNARKLPFLIHHMLDNRSEFSGNTYHFVDKEPVELADLIRTIKSHLALSSPRELYIPYSVARTGKKAVKVILRLLTKVGLKATLPPELMFLNAFYRTQTLSSERLQASSFVDPTPDETIYTRIPDMVIYYLTRWSHQNMITTFDEKLNFETSIENDFQKIIDRMLDLSALENRKKLLKVENVSVQALVSTVLEGMEVAFSGKQIRVKVNVPDDVIIAGDSFLLHQAFGNLLQNAVDFSYDKGLIDIKVETNDDNVCFTVADEGTGIAEYARDRVFEKFFSLQRPDTGQKSTGLGLNFVRQVALLHGGSVRLENRIGGARAVFVVAAKVQDLSPGNIH